MTSDSLPFRHRLKSAREAAQLTQNDLGIKAGGVAQTEISRYENGDYEPGLTRLRALADALEVTADYLLGRSDQP